MNTQVLAMAAALTCSLGVQAQNHVSKGTIVEGGWSLKAIFDYSTEQPSVKAVIALAQPSGTVGNNLVGVCYVPDAESNSGWTGKAWTDGDRAAIIKSLKVSWNLPDEEDVLWDIDLLALKNATPAAQPRPFKAGLLTEDPLYPVVSILRDDSIVEILKQVGYPATSVPFEKWQDGYECLPKWSFAGIAAGLKSLEANNDSAIASSEMLVARAAVSQTCGNIFETIWEWLRGCESITKGAWFPGTNSVLTCGPIISAQEVWSTTIEGRDGSITVSGPATCFSQTCFDTVQRTVTYTNTCSNTTTTVTEVCTRSRSWKCCMAGVVAPGPGGAAPCAMQVVPANTQYLNCY